MCGSERTYLLYTPENDQPTAVPTADPMFAAVALLEQFSSQNHPSADALLDTTDPRELVAGLIDVAGFLVSMVGNATGATNPEVLQHLRSTILGLVNEGRFSTGSFQLPG
jgi:hypothetical protein